MSRLLKISLTLVALVVAILVLLVIRVVTLDPNDYKDWIVTRFEEQTGRSLTLEGEIGLDLYPWLDLRLERVEVGNQTGFGDTPLMRAESARIRVKTLPLLSQRYEIEAVQLQGVSINLAVNEAGTGNWVDLGATEQPTAPAGVSGGGFPLTDLIIGGVEVADFSLRYEDRRSDTFYQVSDLQFSIGELIYGTPIDLSMTLEAVTNQPELSAAVTLAGTLIYDLDSDRYQLAPLNLTAVLSGATLPQQGAAIELATAMDVDLRQDSVTVNELTLTGLDTSLLATVRGEAISSNQASYQGEVTVSGENLSQLFLAAGVDELAGRLAELSDSSFQLNASGTFQAGLLGNAEMTDITANLLGANLEGSLQLMGINTDSPTARGALNASGPDLPLVVEVAGQLTGGSDSQLVVAGRELGQVAEREFNVNLEFNADVNDGTVSVPTLDARLLGNAVNGQFQATSINSETPRLAGVLDAEGPDLPLLLQIGAWFQGGPESSLFQIAEQLRQQGNGDFIFNTQFDADLAQGDIAVPVLSASALGLQLNGVIDASGMTGNNGRINGNLSLEGSEISSLLTALDQPELAEIMERMSVNLQLSGNRSNLVIDPLQADFVVSGPQIPNSPVSLTVDAATRINLDEESLSLDSFAVIGLGLDASGRLDMEGPFDAPTFSGQLELASFNPRDFLTQLNQPVPITSDPSVLQRMAMSSLIEGSLDSLSLEEFSLLLDDTAVTGTMLLSINEKIAAGFELAVSTINVDRYLAPESQEGGSAAEPAKGTEIPVEQLRNLDIEGQVQIGQFVLSGLQLSETQLSMNVSDGIVELSPLTTSLYRGTLDASASLSVAGAEPVASIDIDLRQVDLEPLLFDLMDASYVSGRGNVRLVVNGSGFNSTAIQQSLNGNGSVQLEDGVLKGVDVAAVLRQVETMIRSRQPGSLERGAQTAFESFSSTLAINNGVISSNDLLILSPGFQVTGQGTLLDLSDQSIAFNLATTVDESTVSSTDASTSSTPTSTSSTSTSTGQQYDLGGYSLPIACSGYLSTPRCLPDAGEILRARLQQEVQERMVDLLDRSLGIEREEAVTPGTDDQRAEEPAEQELPNLRDEIINRALDRIFN